LTRASTLRASSDLDVENEKSKYVGFQYY